MWFGKHKRTAVLQPPEGYGREDIRTQSSICTGETLIGFADRKTGELHQAVCVHNTAEIQAYYRLYGYKAE